MTKEVTIQGMMCAMCEKHVKESLEKLEGVESAAASHEKGTATLVLSGEVSDEAIAKAVEDAGYKVAA